MQKDSCTHGWKMSVQKSTRNKMRLGQIKAILHFQESAVILIVVNGKTVQDQKGRFASEKKTLFRTPRGLKGRTGDKS